MSHYPTDAANALTREELYDLVWASPAISVAAGFGISSTALKKICARHNIPTPARGFWARHKRGFSSKKQPLPQRQNERSANIEIRPSPQHRMREAMREARVRVELGATPESDGAEPATPNTSYSEPSVLAPTRKALLKARPNKYGFVNVGSSRIVSAMVGALSIERLLSLLGRFVRLAEAGGHTAQTSDKGVVLIIQGQAIAFAIEELPINRDSPLPSGRLAIKVDANAYHGLRRKFSDRKNKLLEDLLVEVLAGFVEHASHLAERRRADEERQRESQNAERKRKRHAAYAAREKRRAEFVNAIADKLAERQKISSVLAHLESFNPEQQENLATIIAWIRRHLQQIDALLCADALGVSAGLGKVAFAEPKSPQEGAEYEYRPPIELRLWSFDYETGLATSRSELEWAELNGLLSLQTTEDDS